MSDSTWPPKRDFPTDFFHLVNFYEDQTRLASQPHASSVFAPASPMSRGVVPKWWYPFIHSKNCSRGNSWSTLKLGGTTENRLVTLELGVMLVWHGAGFGRVKGAQPLFAYFLERCFHEGTAAGVYGAYGRTPSPQAEHPKETLKITLESPRILFWEMMIRGLAAFFFCRKIGKLDDILNHSCPPESSIFVASFDHTPLIWRFPKIEVHLVIIHLSRIFRCKPSIWGCLRSRKPPYD